jgi:GMP synthase (glutamine-hydrolysing)
MTREAIIVTHHPLDAPGAIARELLARGVTLREVRAHAGDDVPAALERASALVVMGGPMAAEDDADHPFLAAEKRLLAAATSEGAHVLGVCLGAQLLACASGGGIVRAGVRPMEIGWYEVERFGDDPLFDVLPANLTPFHWHGDLIVAPPHAVVLGRSRVTPVQAFRLGERAYGIQFHLESTASMIDAMVRDGADELASEGLDLRTIEEATRAYIGQQERLAARFFGAWADGVARGRGAETEALPGAYPDA